MGVTSGCSKYDRRSISSEKVVELCNGLRILLASDVRLGMRMFLYYRSTDIYQSGSKTNLENNKYIVQLSS